METCEEREYRCCDLYPDAQYAAERGHELPLDAISEHPAWYEEHVARFRENPPRTDEPAGRYVNLSRTRLGLEDPVIPCGWPTECDRPAVAVAVKLDTERLMVRDDRAVCEHHAKWLQAARVLDPGWHVLEVK